METETRPQRRSVTVIVPTVLGGERLRAAVGSVDVAAEDRELLVVNNSADEAAVAPCAELAGVRILAMGRNTGFSHAVNRAAAEARGEVLVLLNDDCVCEPGFLDEISATVDPGQGIVMAASVLLDPRDRSRVESAGMELDRTLAVFDYMHGRPASSIAPGLRDPIGPSAAAAAFDTAAFLGAGGFDERIFAYWEDVDLVLRLRLDGAGCVLAQRARATHQLSATLGVGSAEKNRLMGFGRAYILRKWRALSPARAPAILLHEAAICGGQLLLDRSAAGIAGRIAGWRAARPTFPYPQAELAAHPAPPVRAQLGRRLRRRLTGADAR